MLGWLLISCGDRNALCMCSYCPWTCSCIQGLYSQNKPHWKPSLSPNPATDSHPLTGCGCCINCSCANICCESCELCTLGVPLCHAYALLLSAQSPRALQNTFLASSTLASFCSCTASKAGFGLLFCTFRFSVLSLTDSMYPFHTSRAVQNIRLQPASIPCRVVGNKGGNCGTTQRHSGLHQCRRKPQVGADQHPGGSKTLRNRPQPTPRGRAGARGPSQPSPAKTRQPVQSNHYLLRLAQVNSAI